MKSISEIKREFEQAGELELPALFAQYESDARNGVTALIVRYRKQLAKLSAERERLEKMRCYEHQYEQQGLVCGIDEAGRAAVILPKNCEILYLNDSKQLTEKRREAMFDEIKDKAVAYGIGMASPARIDEINILQATYEAMRQAIAKLNPQPQVLLNDAVRIPGVALQQVPIIKGDAKSLSIAAASVFAKVTRDRLMREYDALMPEYGFASNKGYGSAAHIEALQQYGPTPIHRRSFIGNFIPQ